MGQLLGLVRHFAQVDEQVIGRTVPWGKFKAAFDAGPRSFFQLLFIDIVVERVIAFVVEVVEIAVEVLIFVRPIFDCFEIEFRDVLPHQRECQRPFPAEKASPFSRSVTYLRQ